MSDMFSQEKEVRERRIIRTGVISIIANAVLSAVKAGVGLVTGSIAIVLDAVNNLSDALSSAITILGAKLAGRAPDKKHPLGHGRVEYMSATLVSVIILYAGIMSLTESVRKILHPEPADYTPLSLILVALAVAVKIFLGRYLKKTGRETNSCALVASGEDAALDAVISASTLAAAGIYLATGFSPEAYLGALIGIVIIRAGLSMLRNTVSELMGERVDEEMSRGVKETVRSVPGVLGAYDLILHNYGPGRLMGSVHVEVDEALTAVDIDILSRTIERAVYEKNGVIITGVTIYASNITDPKIKAIRDSVQEICLRHPHVKEMHGFYAVDNAMTFDIVVDFDAKDRDAVCAEVKEEVQKAFPEMFLNITIDRDISD